jgi:hypothetical protein
MYGTKTLLKKRCQYPAVYYPRVCEAGLSKPTEQTDAATAAWPTDGAPSGQRTNQAMNPIDASNPRQLEHCLCLALSLMTEKQRRSFARLPDQPLFRGIPSDLSAYAKDTLIAHRINVRTEAIK